MKDSFLFVFDWIFLGGKWTAQMIFATVCRRCAVGAEAAHQKSPGKNPPVITAIPADAIAFAGIFRLP